MNDPRAELFSIASTLDDLTHRIASMAEGLNAVGDDELATQLFEVERTLNGGRRRLSRIVQN